MNLGLALLLLFACDGITVNEKSAMFTNGGSSLTAVYENIACTFNMLEDTASLNVYLSTPSEGLDNFNSLHLAAYPGNQGASNQDFTKGTYRLMIMYSNIGLYTFALDKNIQLIFDSSIPYAEDLESDKTYALKGRIRITEDTPLVISGNTSIDVKILQQDIAFECNASASTEIPNGF